MRSLESSPVEVAIDSPVPQESVLSSGSNSGSLREAKHLMERLNTAQVKVKRLQRLEAALVDFFMEVMDRTRFNDGVPQPLQIESTFVRSKHKEQFLKKAEGDPISLLNGLRTHLRLKFAEQEAQEAAAERRALAESLNNQHKDQNTQDKFLQLDIACNQLKDQRNSLMRQLNQHEVDQARTRLQHQALFEKLNAHIQEERCREREAQHIITKQLHEIATLKEARDALIKVAQSQKCLDGSRSIVVAAVLDAKCSSTATAFATISGLGTSPFHTNGEFFGTPAENQTLRRALRKYEVKMAQTEAASEERKREVQRLQQQLTGLRQSTQLQMYSRLEKESRHLRDLADELKSRLSESEADLLRTKGTLKEREAQIQKMKDEYARLFAAVQKQKQPAHYSPSKMLTRSASTMQLSQSNHSQPSRLSGGGLADIFSQLNDNAGSVSGANGEHPYVVEHYRSEVARVERESEALKLQIRHMMASEQLYKQKTRVLRAEKQNLIRERDQLRSDLDRAKKHSTLQNIAMNRQQSHPLAGPRKVGYSSVSQDVKHLQKRNAFLEERFRKSLQSSSALATIGAVARLRNSVSAPSELATGESETILELESEFEEAGENCNDGRIARHNSAIFTKTRPASALAASSKSNEGSFRSLDAATLQSLQQVKKVTRMRPQSANPIKYFDKLVIFGGSEVLELKQVLKAKALILTDRMNGGFDGLDGPKHERVAKALEQVNGFRYRYHPAPQDGKKMLRFDSDDDEDGDISDGEDCSDDGSGNDAPQDRSSKAKPKHGNDKPGAPVLTLDDHIENLLCKTRTLAMLKIANNTAGTIHSDSEDDSDEADDLVSEELSIGSLSVVGSPKHGASASKLSSLGSSSSMGGHQSGLLGTAAMRLARTLSAFLCLPRAISYVDLEAITEKLLESANDQFDDDEYAHLIDCHVDSARDDDSHTEGDEEEPIWKRRKSRPIVPLSLSEDPTDLELHQRHIFMEANRFGGVSSRNFFLASSKHLLSKEDSKGSMYFGVSPSGRLLGASMNGSSRSLDFSKQGSSATVTSNSSSNDTADIDVSQFDEEEYIKWRTQVKEDYLAWLNAKVEAKKRRKSRVKKVDANKKPRWLLLYEASKHPTQKYRPDEKQ